MDFITSRLFVIYISGVIVIISAFVYLIYFHFRDDDNIDIKEHFGILAIYIILLIMAIYLWGIISNFIDTIILKIELYKKLTEIKIG
ncbi:hypothetical protein [Caminibacter sp.]